MEDLIDILEKEKAALKAKYKHKVIVKTETVRAELSKELIAITADCERKTEALTEKECELQDLYVRVEELEMMQSTNKIEVKDIHRRYKVMVSQLKTEKENLQLKFLAKI